MTTESETLDDDDEDAIVADEMKIEIRDNGIVNGKPQYAINVLTILNFASKFHHKLLCDGWTYSLGSACHFKCTFCYVLSIVRKHPQVKVLIARLKKQGLAFEDVCIVRHDAIPIMRGQLLRRRDADMDTTGVVFTSPLVDCAATKRLALQTTEADRLILELTAKAIRHLSKGASYRTIVEAIPKKHHGRLIFGYSTGTLDDKIAAAIEVNTASPTARCAELHWLQDHGFRTYGMVCPVLPRNEYRTYAQEVIQALRVEHLEHCWVEPLNLRGKAMVQTRDALRDNGFHEQAKLLEEVFSDINRWEQYARDLFEAFAAVVPPEKLRFLQYVKPTTREWWHARRHLGAIPLGVAADL